VVRSFRGEVMSRQLVELVVDERYELDHRVAVAATQLIEELGHLQGCL